MFNPVQFIREATVELKKVHTPTWEETWRASLAVFGLIFIFGIFLGATDALIGYLVKSILGA